MAPKIDPGGLLVASGGALAGQEAARRAQSQNKDAKVTKSRPKSAKKRFLADFAKKLAPTRDQRGPAWRNARGPEKPILAD